MPQLDSASFISQIVWLVVIFVVFFLVIQKNIVPFISRLLKVRQKKLNWVHQTLSNLNQEQMLISKNYNKFVVSASNKLEALLFTESNKVNGWVSVELSKLSGDVNISFNAIFSSFIQKNFLFSYLRKN